MADEIVLGLLRHGRSQADDERVHEGRYDSPLTEAGRAQVQARAFAWWEQCVSFDHIIASPLKRAAESAAIVGETLAISLEHDADWMEMDNGPLAGLSFEEARLRYPKAAFAGPYQAKAGKGESEARFHSRIACALDRVVQRGPGRYLVVAHGGSLNAALRVALAIPWPINGAGGWFAFGDAGYCELAYRADRHQWWIRRLEPGVPQPTASG